MLTDKEHEAIALTGQLVSLLREIILEPGDEGELTSRVAAVREHDTIEVVTPIHLIQNMILAQSAARVYPEKYRLLGGIIAK